MNNQINNLFGTSRSVFSLQKLKLKLTNGFVNDFKEAKDYFTTYYAKSLMNGYYYYQPMEKSDSLISNVDETEMNQVFKQISHIQYTDTNGNNANFDLKKWFNLVYDSQYSIGFDPVQGLFYSCPYTEKIYINMAKSFLHKERKPYDSYSDDIKQKVDKVLYHLKNVWNSGNEKCYEYTLNHMAYACTGRKMKSCIFLKSGEGTGKSIILEFIIKHVIGEHLGLITGRANQLCGFNYQLLGKLIVVLEELPTASKNEWFSLSDILKQLITGSKLEVEKKHSDMISVANNISLYILTNNDNTIKFGKDMRRYFMADISHDVVGDSKYFQELANICDSRDVGEAFFMYLLERVDKYPNFDESIIPMSENKLTLKSLNLTPILKFVKDEYLKKGLGLLAKSKCGMISLKDFHESFLSFCDEGKDLSNIQKFHIELKRDIPIIKTISATRNKNLHIEQISFDELLEYYRSKGFWSDAFDSSDDEPKPNDFEYGIPTELEIINNNIDNHKYDSLQKDNDNLIAKQKDYENIINELKEKINQLEAQLEAKDTNDIEKLIDDFQPDEHPMMKPIKQENKLTVKNKVPKKKKNDDIEFIPILD